MEENPEKNLTEKESDIKKGFLRIWEKTALLHESGASLRLIAAALGTPNYCTAYSTAGRFSERVKRGGCGHSRPTRDEQKLLSIFCENYPKIYESMVQKKITPRQWCSAYGFIRDAGGADLSMLMEPLISDYYAPDEYTKPVRPIDLLREDFPESFDLKPAKYADISWETGYPRYDFLAIDPALYWRDKKVTSKKGGFNHVCSNMQMGLYIVTHSLAQSRSIFTQRIRQEICIRRIEMLLEAGLDNAEGMIAALRWLPETEARFQIERKKELASRADHSELFAKEGALERELKEIMNRSWKKNNDETRKVEIKNEIKELRKIRTAIAKDINKHHQKRRAAALERKNRDL